MTAPMSNQALARMRRFAKDIVTDIGNGHDLSPEACRAAAFALDNCCDQIEELQAERRVKVPAGYTIVPVEPTIEQQANGADALFEAQENNASGEVDLSDEEIAADIYRAMVGRRMRG